MKNSVYENPVYGWVIETQAVHTLEVLCDEYGVPHSRYSTVDELCIPKPENYSECDAVRCRATRADMVAILNECKVICGEGLKLNVFRN